MQLTWVLKAVGVFIKFTVQTLNAQLWERFTDHQRIRMMVLTRQTLFGPIPMTDYVRNLFTWFFCYGYCWQIVNSQFDKNLEKAQTWPEPVVGWLKHGQNLWLGGSNMARTWGWVAQTWPEPKVVWLKHGLNLRLCGSNMART